MSTSRPAKPSRLDDAGFTALELLVALALSLLLIVGVAPLATSLQAAGAREADRTVAVLQGRVAVARLERDLRMATAAGADFAVGGPVLEATPRQVVFLSRKGGTSELCLIEWEIVGSTLMRRWGPCPQRRPSSFAHTLYVDNKSMLEGLAPDSCLSYTVNGVVASGAVPEGELASVQGVMLHATGRDGRGDWPVQTRGTARVGL